MKMVLVVGFFLFFLLEGRAQKLEWQPLAQIPVKGLDQISLDNRGNIFYADKGGNVFKLDATGTALNQYSPRFQSKLNQLDAFFTVNIFMFSADLQQIVLLDVFLSPITTLSLDQEDLGIIKAATLGNNNIFWLFDETYLSLVQYDFKRRTTLQVQPLAALLGIGQIEVMEILERHNLVFMNIKNQGIFIFDNQGNYINKLKHFFTQKLQVFNDHIFYVKTSLVHQVNIYNGNENLYALPDPQFKKIYVGSNKVFFYSSSAIHIYDQPGFK